MPDPAPSETETVLEELAALIEAGGFGGGSRARGGSRAFVMGPGNQRVVWAPEGPRSITGVSKQPGSSTNIVVAKADLTPAAIIASIGAQYASGILIYADLTSTTSSASTWGMNVHIEKDEPIYINWATSSAGLITLYFDYI